MAALRVRRQLLLLDYHRLVASSVNGLVGHILRVLSVPVRDANVSLGGDVVDWTGGQVRIPNLGLLRHVSDRSVRLSKSARVDVSRRLVVARHGFSRVQVVERWLLSDKARARLSDGVSKSDSPLATHDVSRALFSSSVLSVFLAIFAAILLSSIGILAVSSLLTYHSAGIDTRMSRLLVSRCSVDAFSQTFALLLTMSSVINGFLHWLWRRGTRFVRWVSQLLQVLLRGSHRMSGFKSGLVERLRWSQTDILRAAAPSLMFIV